VTRNAGYANGDEGLKLENPCRKHPDVRHRGSKETTRVWAWRQRFVTDEAWALISPLLPVAAATGRPRKWALRQLLEAVLYLLRTGCQWRALPDALPPYSTVQRHFYAWRDAGLFERINHLLVMVDDQHEGREASPSAAVIDSQSVKTSETGKRRDTMAARNSWD